MKEIYLSTMPPHPDWVRRQPDVMGQPPIRPTETDWFLRDLALLFCVQSEHFDRQQPHTKNDRGVAIPRGSFARRVCEGNARRLINDMFIEYIYRRISITHGEWRRLIKKAEQEFEALLQQGWMDKNAAIKQFNGEFIFVPRNKFATCYRFEAQINSQGTTAVSTYYPTGKFIVQHGACAEIFEPINS